MTTKRIQITEHPLDAETAKEWLKVEHDAEDSLIEGLIHAAVDMAEQHTGRAIAKARYRASLLAFPVGAIKLSWPPVESITSIRYRSPEGEWVVLDPVSYVADFGAEPCLVRSTASAWPAVQAGGGVVEVEFVAGYGAACPEAINRWVLAHVAHWYRNREAASEKALSPLPYLDRLMDRYCMWSMF